VGRKEREGKERGGGVLLGFAGVGLPKVEQGREREE
jgi:hypothetical protein